MVAVSPTTEEPTHHISLTDGTSTLGLVLCDRNGNPDERGIRESGMPRTATRISQGPGGYGDFEYPYTPIAQGDFSGGRGMEDFEADTTRYLDSFNVDTTRGDITLTGKRTDTTGINGDQRSAAGTGAVGETSAPGTPVVRTYASSFTAAFADLSAISVTIHNPPSMAPGATQSVTVKIRANTAGAPGSTLFTATVDAPQGALMLPVSGVTLTVGTVYWITVKAYVVGISAAAAKSFIRSSDDGATWYETTTGAELTYTIHRAAATDARYFLQEYRGQMVAVVSFAQGGLSKMFTNGLRGFATSNSADLWKLNTTMNLSARALANCIVQIVAGPGVEEETNWRRISSNTTTGTNDVITVTRPWNIAHTTATEYVIQGLNTWEEQTGYTPTTTVTDVKVVNNAIYVAHGPDAANITRVRTNPATGAWEFVAETSVRADLITACPDTAGTLQVYLCVKGTSSVWRCPAVDWSTALTATQINGAKPVGNARSRITNMVTYGDPQRVWIFKEDEFGSINSDIYARVPLDEYRSVKSQVNGRAAFQHGTYLYFSLLEGLERYYEQRLDDVGPNRDEGMPKMRTGTISALIGYPGRFFAAIDGGENNFSSVLCHNGIGWHEVYRSRSNGSRITAMLIQPIPGTRAVDRLWIADGSDVLWVPISINPRKDLAYTYEKDGWLETGWITGSLKDITKYWNSVKVFTEGCGTATGQEASVLVEYATDADIPYYEMGEVTWHEAGTVSASPMQEIQLGNYDVEGKRIKLRLSLHSEQDYRTPRVKMVLLEAVTRVPVKRTWNVTFYLDDEQFDLNHDGLGDTAKEGMDLLRDWADSREQALPLLMRHNHELFDNLRVFIEPASVAPLGIVHTPDRRARLVGTMSLLEA